MTSDHLLDEYPLIVLPTLACAIGLNEAIVLQQINYWISNKKIGKLHNGLRWVRNSIEEWHVDNFPFWSIPTIKRIMGSLDNQQVILKAILNDNPYDKTLWYTVNRPVVLAIVSKYQIDTIERINPIRSTQDQNDPIDGINPIPSITDNTSDTTDNTPRKQKRGGDPKPRVRDLIFDAIARDFFGVDLEDKPAVALVGSRVSGIKKRLLAADPALTADELENVAIWLRSKNADLDMPQHEGTIGKAIVAYRNEFKGGAKSNGRFADYVDHPDQDLFPGVKIPRSQAEELKRKGNG